MDKVEQMVCCLSSDVEIRIEWNGDKDQGHEADARINFLISVAHRTNELNLSNTKNFCDPSLTLNWPVLRSVSLRNIHGTYLLSIWMASLVGLKELRHVEWSIILVKINFAGLEWLQISSSHLPVELLSQLVDRIPRAGGYLSTLAVECDDS